MAPMVPFLPGYHGLRAECVAITDVIITGPSEKSTKEEERQRPKEVTERKSFWTRVKDFLVQVMVLGSMRPTDSELASHYDPAQEFQVVWQKHSTSTALRVSRPSLVKASCSSPSSSFDDEIVY